MPHLVTPANSPVRPGEVVPAYPTVGQAVLTHSHHATRVGGGYSNEIVAQRLFGEAQAIADQFKERDSSSFNPSLANYVEQHTREQQERNAFLLPKQALDRTLGVAYYENTTEPRPPVVVSQLHQQPQQQATHYLLGGPSSSDPQTGGAAVSWANASHIAPYHGGVQASPIRVAQHNESVMLLATGSPSSPSRAPQPTLGGGGAAYAANDSMMSLDRPTYSSMNKTRFAKDVLHNGGGSMLLGSSSGAAGRVRPNSSNIQHRSSVAGGGSSSRLSKFSKVQLDRSMHAVDASCCGYNHPVQHSKVDGLYVTFCETTTETKLFNAVRDLELEKGQRELDEKRHRQQLASYLRQVEELRSERDALLQRVNTQKESHTNQAKDLEVVKDQYADRYRQKVQEWETISKELEQLKAELHEVRAESGSRLYRIQELESENRMLKGASQATDKQSMDLQNRLAAAVAEAATLRSHNDVQVRELADARQLLEAKTQLIAGLQRELNVAQDKIMGVAILRDSVNRANKRR